MFRVTNNDFVGYDGHMWSKIINHYDIERKQHIAQYVFDEYIWFNSFSEMHNFQYKDNNNVD